MRQFLAAGLEASIAALLLIPVFAVLERRYFHDRKRTAWYFLFAVYLSGVYAVVGLPDVHYAVLDFNINLKPFAYMFSAYRTSSLNVVLFVPMGFFLPALWKRYRSGWRTVLFGFCVSLLIELLQLFTFRATDVNDLMTNTLGAVLGWCLGRLFVRLLPGAAGDGETWEAYLVCGVSFGVMFFFQPFLADFVWSLIL